MRARGGTLSALSLGLILVTASAFGAEGALKVTLRPYFFAGTLQFEADAAGSGAPDSAGNRVSVALFRAAGGEALARGVVRRTRQRFYDDGQLPIEKLAPGDYRVEARLQDAAGKWLGAAVSLPLTVPAKPEWYDSKAGVTDEVLPPWTPLQVKERTVSCWGREYRFSDSPFPAQIVSAGKEILRAPISIRLTARSAPVLWKDASIKVAEAGPAKAALRAQADSALAALQAETTIEYDGMVRVDCTLTPKGAAELDGLIVEVPLKQEHALYLNCPWVTRYSNALEYKGAIDRDGWQWKSRFVPSLNIRDDERGLDWACESDEGWKPYDRLDTLQAARKGDRVTLEIKVLGRTTLRKPFKFSMILEATPVRPFPKNYRNLHIVHFQGGPEKDDLTWDIDGFGRTSYPIRGIKRGAEEKGCHTLVYHELWAHGFGRPFPFKPEEFKRVVQYAHTLGMKSLVYYASCFWADSPEYKTYQSDWDVLPREGEVEGVKQAAAGRSDMTYIGCCPRGGQHVNYLTWGLQKLVNEYGVDGIYIDGGEAFPCSNRGHGCGYVNDETGEVRPTWCVLACRELRKRCYAILHANGRAGQIDQHLPYGQTAPIHAFTDTYLAGEPLAHNITAENRISLPWMRAEFTGLQFGTPPELLVYNGKLIQKHMAYALPHGAYLRVLTSDYIYLQGADIFDWMSMVWKTADDFGIEEAQWRPYWKNADVVKVSPSEVLVSIYQRPDKGALLFVGNIGMTDAHVTVALDLASLGLAKASLKADDPMTKRPVVLNGNKISFDMKAETFAPVWIRAEK